MRTLRSTLLALAVAILAGTLGTGTAIADTVVIDAVDSPAPAFAPPNVSIHTGDTVRFEFDAATTTHTVTSTSANWSVNETKDPNSAPISRTFDTAGTYTFVCSVHTGMSGSITVADAPANTLSKVLVFSKTAGFRHDSIPQGIAAIQALGTANGFTVDATEDAAQFTDANLAQYDVVVFLSTTGDVLNDAQQTAFEVVRPGIACQEVDRAARKVITDAGYGEQFIHRTGHGIGLTTHEPPYMVEGEQQPLEPGMCFSIEPGIYLAGRFGVRIEDIVTVTEDGGRRFNDTPREIQIVA